MVSWCHLMGLGWRHLTRTCRFARSDAFQHLIGLGNDMACQGVAWAGVILDDDAMAAERTPKVVGAERGRLRSEGIGTAQESGERLAPRVGEFAMLEGGGGIPQDSVTRRGRG